MAASGTFPIVTRHTVSWRRLDGNGLEHLTLERFDRRITATSVVTSVKSGDSYGVWYQVFADADWHIKAVSVHRTDSRWFIAKCPEPGRWCDGDGRALDALDGCLGLACAATPFTHTLAIRRHELAVGEAIEEAAVLLPFNSLEPARHRLRYTCLEPAERYRCENLDRGLSVELSVDHHGLAVEVQEQFSRLD